MSGIEYLHPLLGEQKQHIQGRGTWSESKLMIGNLAIGVKKDLMSEAMMDSITLLMIGRRLIGLLLQESVLHLFMQGSNVC